MKGGKNKLRALKVFMRFLFSLLALCGVYFFLAIIFSLLPTHPPDRECPANDEIFIVSNGVHLDIVIPVEALDPAFLRQLDLITGTRFVAFGWGDKEFYIKTPEWSDLTFPVAFRALFLKSETAMHVTCLPYPFLSWNKITLCKCQMERLNDYIQSTFKTDEAGNLMKINFDGYTAYDFFYDARGSFSLFRTCNVWVNRAMKVTGLKTSVWSPFTFGILFHIRKC